MWNYEYPELVLDYLAGRCLTSSSVLLASGTQLVADTAGRPASVWDLKSAFEKPTASGLTILLCEQNTKLATALSDRVIVLEKGQVRFSATIAELEQNDEGRQQYLSV